jgi:hypothetical protein
VSICLPRSSELIIEDHDTLPTKPKLPRPATILVVEDDPEVRKASSITHPIGTTQARPRHDLWTK